MILEIFMNANQCFKTSRASLEVDAQSDWIPRLPKLVLLMLAGIGFLFLPSMRMQVVAEELVRCKYSVRDVAFVNVHGKSWQLRLVKPAAVAPERFEKWNLALRNQLADSNVGYAWYDLASDIGKQIQLANPNATQKPLMDLVRLGAADSSIAVSSSAQLEEGLQRLVSSPARDEIFSKVVDALCVFVLVQSGNKSKDAVAEAEVMAAVKRVNDQMWTLEKPTDSGPSIVIVPQANHSEEKWLLSSLGITDHEQPAVAVLYGQGRLLGEVLSGPEITVDAIVTRASICGQDCECSLNRNWLYGIQVLHRWDQALERRAEASLDFDPNSAFVMAEVAQILQKNAGQINQAPPVMLGGGLVIHELADLDADRNLELDLEASEVVEGSSSNDVGEKETVEPSEALAFDDRKSVIAVPWTILVLFSGLVLMFALFLISRS
ncbi:hypothetical protein N9B05_06325 [Mariniblastus sp.]|nr:hypothetical protein [Mariniblastus sp.]